MKKTDFYITAYGGRDNNKQVIYKFYNVSCGYLDNYIAPDGSVLQIVIHKPYDGKRAIYKKFPAWQATEFTTGQALEISGATIKEVKDKLTDTILSAIVTALQTDNHKILQEQLRKHIDSLKTENKEMA